VSKPFSYLRRGLEHSGPGVISAEDLDTYVVRRVVEMTTATSVVLGLGLALVMVVMSALSPLSKLNRRLSFLLVGLVLLVALNQLSLYTPVIREWLKPPV
jgi:hypothetical protein